MALEARWLKPLAETYRALLERKAPRRVRGLRNQRGACRAGHGFPTWMRHRHNGPHARWLRRPDAEAHNAGGPTRKHGDRSIAGRSKTDATRHQDRIKP